MTISQPVTCISSNDLILASFLGRITRQQFNQEKMGSLKMKADVVQILINCPPVLGAPKESLVRGVPPNPFKPWTCFFFFLMFCLLCFRPGIYFHVLDSFRTYIFWKHIVGTTYTERSLPNFTLFLTRLLVQKDTLFKTLKWNCIPWLRLRTLNTIPWSAVYTRGKYFIYDYYYVPKCTYYIISSYSPINPYTSSYTPIHPYTSPYTPIHHHKPI